jgi:hypothetical protein
MKKLWLFLIVLTASVGCDTKESKRDIYLKCEGKIRYQIITNSIEVSSGFYIGKDFVEQEGTRYMICEESKTRIRYSDDCKKTQQTEGTIDLIIKNVSVDNSLKKVTPSIEEYQCEAVKSPRY